MLTPDLSSGIIESTAIKNYSMQYLLYGILSLLYILRIGNYSNKRKKEIKLIFNLHLKE